MAEDDQRWIRKPAVLFLGLFLVFRFTEAMSPSMFIKGAKVAVFKKHLTEKNVPGIPESHERNQNLQWRGYFSLYVVVSCSLCVRNTERGLCDWSFLTTWLLITLNWLPIDGKQHNNCK